MKKVILFLVPFYLCNWLNANEMDKVDASGVNYGKVSDSLNKPKKMVLNLSSPVTKDSVASTKDEASQSKNNAMKIKFVTKQDKKVVSIKNAAEQTKKAQALKPYVYADNKGKVTNDKAMKVKLANLSGSEIIPLKNSYNEKGRRFFSAFNQEDSKVDFKQVINEVLGWHPLIKRYEASVKQYEAAVKTAQSGYFPQMQLRVDSGYEENSSGEKPFTSNLVLSASQNIFDFGKTKNKVSLARETLNKEQASLESSVEKLLYDLVGAYLQLSRYFYLVDIAKENVKGIEKLNAIVEKRTSLGASAYSDYSQAKEKLASARVSLDEYKSQLNRWSATVDTLANKDISVKMIKTFDLPWLVDGCKNIDVNDISSATLEVAKAQINMAKAQLKATQSDMLPSIQLVPSYSYELKNNADKNGFLSMLQKKKKGMAKLNLSLSVPILEGGAQIGRKDEAYQALMAAQHNLDAEIFSAKQRMLESSRQINSVSSSLDMKLDKEDINLKIRDLYMQQYLELGTRSFLDLITAESAIYSNKFDIVNTFYNMDNLLLECVYNSGQLVNLTVN